MTSKTTPKNPDVSEIEVKDDDVHSLVSKWMDDTLGLSDTDENDDGTAGHKQASARTAAATKEQDEEEEEVRMPRVGLGAEDKAERSAWKTHEAAAERLAPGARGVAQKLLQQGRQAARRLGAGGRAGRGDDEDDGDSRLGSIVKLSAKKKGAQKADAVTKIIEEKQKKRERKAAAKAAKEAGAGAVDAVAPAPEKQEEEEEEKSMADAGEPAEKKVKTGEAFADGDDFISLPPAESAVPEWKKKRGPRGGQGEGGRKKERYVRPENVAPRTAKIRYQTTADGQTRKRTKTRSKQKNLRRDHRPLEKRPTTIPLAPQNTHKTFDDDDD